ncbi:LysR family transcriptional regulator [Pararobbsia alpina]|uniref:LysR family transcriptional regulator n=1 Tax=Pararobbsia alpina TaxID=621374 RepID=UPI0039A5DAD1
MDTLHNMRIFARVVEAGGFTAAAIQMDVTTAHASRAISELEAHLRTRLLNRTTRRIALTDAGERYLARCIQILNDVDSAESEASDAHATPTGRLRVHSMAGFGIHYVVPMIERYQARYPSVQVDLTLAQRIPDLLEEGFDVSIVASIALEDSGFVAQRLGSLYSIACAAPSYLKKHGLPQRLSDLEHHTCLQIVTPVWPPDRWVFTDGDKIEETVHLGASRFTVNVAEAMANAIRAGMGIGVLPISSALPFLQTGEIVRLFAPYRSQELTVHALYASKQYLDAKIRTWIDFLKDTLPDVFAETEAALAAASAKSDYGNSHPGA